VITVEGVEGWRYWVGDWREAEEMKELELAKVEMGRKATKFPATVVKGPGFIC